MAPGLSIAIEEKRFGESTALFSDFRLDVAPGSVVAVLGPSGIGKSSLLRLVAGIDREFAGRILVDGIAADIAPAPGFVFQDPRLLPWLTALENVLLASPGLGAAAAEALLAQVGLGGRGEDFPQQLSGGMQRRAALARALAANPGLLLLDEPFVSLDKSLAREMRDLLSRLITMQKPTVLLVTHDEEDAALLADRVLVLGGRPARIVADLVLDVVRQDRDNSVLAEYRVSLAGRRAGQD